MSRTSPRNSRARSRACHTELLLDARSGALCLKGHARAVAVAGDRGSCGHKADAMEKRGDVGEVRSVSVVATAATHVRELQSTAQAHGSKNEKVRETFRVAGLRLDRTTGARCTFSPLVTASRNLLRPDVRSRTLLIAQSRRTAH
eukprot:5751375-Prymnesium_polylepis.3